MTNKKNTLFHKTIDTIFVFIFKNIYRFLWFIKGIAGRWLCPENSSMHFPYVDECECKRYCHKHDRDEIMGCSVCEILEFNYKDYPLEALDDFFLKVKNGVYSIEEGCLYNDDEYKYFA
tara:strand:+ start:720 stop:1076 length:357 start_codon:yes stop_codon:yes gene_type:complete